jgi:putative hydrolase of the HAD superfamily
LEKLETAKIKAILFDLGDTLIHGNFTAGQTESVWEEIYSQLINPQADPAIPSLAQIRAAWQTHVQSAMARVWREKIEQELEFLPMIQRAFEEAGLERATDPLFLREVVALEHHLLYTTVVEVAPLAIATLKELKRRGYRLGLVSNFCNLPEVAYANIAEVGLLQFFDQSLLSCEFGWRKPSPSIYRAMCEKLEVEPANCLFIGDRLIEDVQGPQRAGMQSIQFTLFRQEEPDPAIQPNAVISDFDQLLELLK